MNIRDRAEADMSSCVALLGDAFEHDQYPKHWPDDPARWIASHRELQAWVACDDGNKVVGHVGMHSAVGDLVGPFWSSQLALPEAKLGVVARLFVAHQSRGAGLGGMLLDYAADRIREQGLVPVMDVVLDRTEVMEFYERRGWRRLGETEARMPNGIPFTVVAYVGPY